MTITSRASRLGRGRVADTTRPWIIAAATIIELHGSAGSTCRGAAMNETLERLPALVFVVLFGIPPLAVLIYPLVGLPVLLLQHANVRVPASLDRALVWLVSTPSMHLVHHSRRTVETDSNYATGLTLWDRLFGTFSPSTSPHGIGVDGFDRPGAPDAWRHAAQSLGRRDDGALRAPPATPCGQCNALTIATARVHATPAGLDAKS
ncbi:MAG: sterol desaturase family protein [Burkholderiales bacterium]